MLFLLIMILVVEIEMSIGTFIVNHINLQFDHCINHRYQSEGLKFDSISLKDNEKNQQEDYKEGFQPNQG